MFPEGCLVCNTELTHNEQHFCTFCREECHLTNFHRFEEPSPMDQLFWGRVHVTATYAHLQFHKNKASQKVLFNLKYNNNQELGRHFGRDIAKNLQHVSEMEDVGAIVPIPLHYRKQFTRGYNQSKVLAEGLSEILHLPIEDKSVKRVRHHSSQTRLSRFKRWDNVQGLFSVHPGIRKYQHLLIVDDVITTGSTIESLIQSICKIAPEMKISVVTLAIA